MAAWKLVNSPVTKAKKVKRLKQHEKMKAKLSSAFELVGNIAWVFSGT